MAERKYTENTGISPVKVLFHNLEKLRTGKRGKTSSFPSWKVYFNTPHTHTPLNPQKTKEQNCKHIQVSNLYYD